MILKLLLHGSSKRLPLLLFAALFTFCSGQAFAQDADESAAGDAQITLNLQDVDIRVLINTVAEVSNKNFIVDPRVKGKVTVISGTTLDPDQLYDVFLSILEVAGFATVNSGSVIKILPSNQIKQRPTPFGPVQETNDAQITQIIQLKYAPVQDLVPIVRPLIPPTSHFAPHIPSNSVVITDTAANIQRVLKIIKRIDVPDKRSGVHVVFLDKTKASDLAATLTQIMASNADVKTAGGANKVTIQPLDAINALVISATDDEYNTLQALIDELDIERELEANINVIYLRHANAEDLVSVLNDVTKSETQGAVAEAVVQADEATNSIIIKASGGQLQTMREVIEKLDIRRPQVFVETVIAEVSLSQAADLGVSWGAGGPNNVTAGVTDGNGNTSAGSSIGNLINRGNPNQIIGTAAINTAFELGTGGLTYTLLDFKKYNLNVIINALRADTNSNILSTPTILTLDNEEAEIVVGQEVPFITGRFNNGFNNNQGDNSNNNSNNTGTGFQTIERKDVGIKLKIKPQISDGNTIKLEVLQEISSVAETAIDGQADLITNRRSITATVQVDDGQVIVLGGLIQDDIVDTVNWVPVLGKIPFIGALFRSKSKTVVKRNLMVFLKPRIIRSADELAKFSKSKYDEVRRDSKLFGRQSSKLLIPNSKPPVLDEYEEVVGEGDLITEGRRNQKDGTEDGNPKPTKLRAMVDKVFHFRRHQDGDSSRGQTQGEFETQGAIDDADTEMEPIIWDDKPSQGFDSDNIQVENLETDQRGDIQPTPIEEMSSANNAAFSENSEPEIVEPE